MAMVALTVVANEMEAEMLCGMLRSNGIECTHRSTGVFADSFGSTVNSAVFGEAATTQVLIDERQLAEARKLLPESQ